MHLRIVVAIYYLELYMSYIYDELNFRIILSEIYLKI